MNKHLVLIFLFFSTTHFSFGQTWVKQNLSNLATISFPAQPIPIDTLGEKIFIYNTDSSHYFISVKKLTGLQLRENELDTFYYGFMKGVLKKTKGKLVSERPFRLDGLKGIEIEYVLTTNPNLSELRFARAIFFNNTIFFYNFWTSSGNREQTETDRNNFFKSFTATADKATIKQYTVMDDDPSYKIGYFIGEILGFIFVITAIVGVIYLIVRGIQKIKKP
jgi:hypothetical protein